jgi:hypothetical protein
VETARKTVGDEEKRSRESKMAIAAITCYRHKSQVVQSWTARVRSEEEKDGIKHSFSRSTMRSRLAAAATVYRRVYSWSGLQEQHARRRSEAGSDQVLGSSPLGMMGATIGRRKKSSVWGVTR